MRAYQHTQHSYLMAIIGGLMVVWMVISAIIFEGAVWISVVSALIVALVFAMFLRLRTSVDRKTVRAAFAFGWPQRRIAIKDIESYEVVRNKWYHGWGIRRIPGGWMFNVWGLDAVDVTYRAKGKTKTFRIGTDDPSGLEAAIAAAVDSRPATG